MKRDETQTSDKTKLVLQVSDKPNMNKIIAIRRHEEEVETFLRVMHKGLWTKKSQEKTKRQIH